MNTQRDKNIKQSYGPVSYEGRLAQHQQKTYANSVYQPHDTIFLNQYQNHLYHRALFGLSVYTQDEIKNMHSKKRKRIIKVSKRTQQVLNTWKQEIIIAMTNRFFSEVFPNTEITKALLSESTADPSVKCNLSFKLLKINKPAIIQKLLCEGILPENFYTLKTEPSCK